MRRKRDPIERSREAFLASFATAFRTGRGVAWPDSVFTESLRRILTNGLEVFHSLDISEDQRFQLYRLYHDELRKVALTPPNIPFADDMLAKCMVDYIADRC